MLKAKGIHAIHSPFVFDFFQNVLKDNRTFYCYDEIELLRTKLMASKEIIGSHDLGAGSHVMSSGKREVGSIAKFSSTPFNYSQLLFRIATYYNCHHILELGTSLGLTSLYLSSASKEAKVVTIEGDVNVASIAQKNFALTGRENITLLRGSFEEQLPVALKTVEGVDLAYLDGNHRKQPTLEYFKSILSSIHHNSIIVTGDIHWSVEMREAWNQIIASDQVSVSIDLFYLGITFFRRELSKQNFVLRF